MTLIFMQFKSHVVFFELTYKELYNIIELYILTLYFSQMAKIVITACI